LIPDDYLQVSPQYTTFDDLTVIEQIKPKAKYKTALQGSISKPTNKAIHRCPAGWPVLKSHRKKEITWF